jgi:hypothetical protein
MLFQFYPIIYPQLFPMFFPMFEGRKSMADSLLSVLQKTHCSKTMAIPRIDPEKSSSIKHHRLSRDKNHMAACQNLVPLVNIKIAGKWMFIPLKMVLIGIDPYPYM